MKKLIRILFLYLIFLTLSIVIHGCCKENHKIIGEGVVRAFSDLNYPFTQLDTVEGKFYLQWELEVAISSLLKNFELTQNCYATTCELVFDNELIETSFSIKSDKDFYYNGSTIYSGTDFSEIADLKIDIEKGLGNILIEFSNSFMSSSNFEQEEYEFTLYAKTSDNIQLTNKRKVYIKKD